MMKLGFIGAGKVGTALAVSLSRKGYPVVAIYDVKSEAAQYFAQEIKSCKIASKLQEVADAADLVFITTTDDLIAPVCSQLKWRAGQLAVHCSGANTIALLESARKQGALVGVFHPDLSFADKKQAIDSIRGATFDIEAREPVLSKFKELAGALDGHWIEIKAEDKPVFHVAVEFSSLFVMLLFKLAAKMEQAMDITTEQAVQVALPMIRATANIIETFGTSRPLTGPADRGDTETIKKHINGLRRLYPAVLPLYRELVRQNLTFSLEHKLIDQKKAEEIRTILDQY
jgi:predicted short-subunit dehydrogenase-like oxidoreductase (DUF2520 family)